MSILQGFFSRDKWNPIRIFKIKLFYWTPRIQFQQRLIEICNLRKNSILRQKKEKERKKVWELQTHVFLIFADLFSQKLAQITNNFFEDIFKFNFPFHSINDIDWKKRGRNGSIQFKKKLTSNLMGIFIVEINQSDNDDFFVILFIYKESSSVLN